MRPEIINTRLVDAVEGVLDILRGMGKDPAVKTMITVLESALKPIPFKGRLSHIPLNEFQGLVCITRSDAVNSVIAAYDKHREVLIIRPEYKDREVDIISVLPAHVSCYDVMYGETFHIDTWDLKIKNHI